jgi:hypothetical protein
MWEVSKVGPQNGGWGFNIITTQGLGHQKRDRLIRLVPPREGCRLPLNFGFLPLPVDPSQMAMACPLRSTGITPASSLLRSSPPLIGASVLSASRLEPLVPFP